MNLTAWNVDDEAWPVFGSELEKLRFLLQFAVLAPSGHNTQPWLFRIVGNRIELYADRRRRLPVVDPDDRELIISCGCALYFLCVAARRFARRARVELLPDTALPDLMARIQIVAAEPAADSELRRFNAILQRRTNRRAFEARLPPDDLLYDLLKAADQHDTWLKLVTKNDRRQALAELIAQGDHIQGADKNFRHELASWVHSNNSSYDDGMPGYAFGVGDVASHLGPFILRTFDWGNGQAAKDQQLASGSPVLAVIGSSTDTAQAWLNTGQALARVLLELTAAGLSASFLNQPVELAELRIQLQNLLGVNDYPQILLRIGYGPEVQAMPRRRVEDILIE